MELLGITIHGRFRLVEKTEDRPLYRRYRALDSKSAESASVLVLNHHVISVRIEDAIRFRADASASTAFTHPGIVHVHEVGEVFDTPCLVMEDAPGVNLTDFLRTGPMPLDRSIDCMIRLAGAVGHAHEKGVLHRNLKPDYIIISEDDVRLFGFGFGHIVEYGELVKAYGAEDLFGYMAPEQGGTMGRVVDERSDLYSLGALFYRLTAGRLPFGGDTASSLFHKHAAVMPEPPGKYNPDVPPQLDRIILKLMEKEPSLRYQSAAGMIADLEKVRNGMTDFIPGGEDRTARIDFRTKLVGRDHELERLMSLHADAIQGRGGICLIGGETGSGKTRLVEELRNISYSGAGVFLVGRCITNENKQPYGPFRDALDRYIALFDEYPEGRKEKLRAAFAGEPPDTAQAILRLNPGIRRVFGEQSIATDQAPQRVDRRFHATAARFLRILGTLEKGLVLVIDDIQWADDGSMDILKEISTGADSHPILLILTYRTGLDGTDPVLNKALMDVIRQSENNNKIDLAPFDLEKMKNFISALLPGKIIGTEQLAEYVHRRSGGRPFFAIEIIRQLVADDVLSRGSGNWECNQDALEQIKVPSNEVDVIIRRIHALDEIEKGVMAFAAVIGNKFDLDLLFSICRCDFEKVVATVDRAASLHLIEPDGRTKGSAVFTHERIREALYAGIPAEERKSLHRSLAAVLEDRYRGNLNAVIFALAHHSIEGEDSERSIRYAFPAGLMARESCAYEDAARYFARTMASIELSGSDEWNNVHLDCQIEIGGINVTTGRYDEAIARLRGILPEAKDPSKRVRIYRHLCDAFYRKGDWIDCEDSASRGLAILGEKVPRKKHQVIARIIAELLVHALHSLFPAVFVRSRPNPRSAAFSMIVDFFEPMSMAYSLNDPLKLVRAALRFLNLAERHIGPSVELAKAYYGFASICMAIPLFDRSERYHLKSLGLNEKLKYDWGRAKNYELLGYFHEWSGNFTRARDSFTNALAIYQKLGDVKERAMVLNGLEHCHYYQGGYRAARSINDRYYEIGTRAGDDYSITASDIYYAQICREQGDLDSAEYHAKKSNDLSRERNIWFNYCSSLVEMGLNAIERGEPGSALQFLESARRLYEENNYLRQYILPVYSGIAQACCDDYAQREHSMPHGERRRQMKKMRSACRRAMAATRKWPTHHGVALRVMGSCHAMRGEYKKARSCFINSIAHTEKFGRKYESARGYYEYGLFLAQRGEAKSSRENLECAYRIFSEIDARLYGARLRIILRIQGETGLTPIQRLIERERSQAVRQVLRDIRGIPDIDGILDVIITRALELVGAQGCYLFLAGGACAPLVLRAARNILETGRMAYSQEIVDETWRQGASTIVNSAGAPRDLDAGQPGAMKSVMCVPMRAEETCIGVCYVEDSLSGRVFTEADSEILSSYLSLTSFRVAEILKRSDDLPSATGDSTQPTVTQNTEEKIIKVIHYIHDNYLYDISREGLASMVDMSPNHLGKSFKIYTGNKIGNYINQLRIEDAVNRLLNTNENIIDIAFSVGFESLRTFNRTFFEIMKKTPTDYRKGP